MPRGRRRIQASEEVATAGLAGVSGLAPQGLGDEGISLAEAAHMPVSKAAARAAEIRGEEPAPMPRRSKKGGMSAEDSKALAKRRAAEILEHSIGIEDDEDDKFHVPADYQPDGWKYQWQRVSVYGKEDPQYQIRRAQTGWTPVPAERHPDMMPSTGGPYQFIERDGMRLMEIPKEIHDLLVKKEQRKALDQVRVKTAQLNQAPPGTFARDEHAQTKPQVRRGYEPLIVPDA